MDKFHQIPARDASNTGRCFLNQQSFAEKLKKYPAFCHLETVIPRHAGQTVLHCIALGRPKTRRAAELLRLVHSHHGDLEAKNNEGQFLGRSNTIACPKWCNDFLHKNITRYGYSRYHIHLYLHTDIIHFITM